MAHSIDNPADSHQQGFQLAYQRPPSLHVSAPGRVNLIGEHIDYNDGFVMPAAIDRRVHMTADRNGQKVIRLRSSHADDEGLIDLTIPPAPSESQPWLNYPLGVLSGFLQDGVQIPGLDVWVESTVPIGGGLSSSAAVSVAFATLLEQATDHVLDPKQKALRCQRAEHDFAGVPCGIMDPFASVLSKQDHLLLIDCQSQDTQLIPFQDPAVSLLIANTGVSHALSTSAYAQRRQQCDSALKSLEAKSWRDVDSSKLEVAKLAPVEAKRARHVITEIARTQAAANRMAADDWSGLGQLMGESHCSLKNDYEVSCDELDLLVEIAHDLGEARGVYGARMTGAGFGGSTISLVSSSHTDAILDCFRKRYMESTGRSLEAFVTRPSTGARVHLSPTLAS